MARKNKDRDRLIRTFQRRTGTSKADVMRDARLAAIADTKRTGRVNTLFPRSAMYTPPNAAKTPRGGKLTRYGSGEPPFKPVFKPRSGAYSVPGLGEYGAQKNARAYAKRHPEFWPDGPPSRSGRGPFGKRRRGRTAPTPGSANQRRPRTYN